jgi:hypothetical protein
VCNKLQTGILHRVELQQSCSAGFPFATGLVQHRATGLKILPRKEASAETERLAKVCYNLQADILHRLEVQQSCSKGFLLATGLVFGTDK